MALRTDRIDPPAFTPEREQAFIEQHTALAILSGQRNATVRDLLHSAQRRVLAALTRLSRLPPRMPLFVLGYQWSIFLDRNNVLFRDPSGALWTPLPPWSAPRPGIAPCLHQLLACAQWLERCHHDAVGAEAQRELDRKLALLLLGEGPAPGGPMVHPDEGVAMLLRDGLDRYLEAAAGAREIPLCRALEQKYFLAPWDRALQSGNPLLRVDHSLGPVLYLDPPNGALCLTDLVKSDPVYALNVINKITLAAEEL